MKTATVNAIEKGISLVWPHDSGQFLKRCKAHLLQDVIPTLLILAIVAGGALMVSRSIQQTRTSHSVTLIAGQ